MLRLPPGGTRATAHASAEPDRDPPQGGPRGDEDTGQDHGKEQDDRPGRADELAERLAGDGAQPSAGVFHLRRRDDDVPWTTGQVQQAEHSQRGHADAERQPPPVLALAVHEERDTAGDERQRQQEPAEAHEGAEPGVDPTSQRPGDAEVDGQGDERAHHDEDQPEQVPPVRVEGAADRGGPRPRPARPLLAGRDEPRGGVLVALARRDGPLAGLRLAMAPTVAMGRASVRAWDPASSGSGLHDDGHDHGPAASCAR